MFTGIVEELGVTVEREPLRGAARLTVRGPRVSTDLRPGDSVAVNGVCLTVVRVDGETFHADVMAETLARTTLGTLAPGDPVNLERPLTPSDRLGGHLVQGHVDATAPVLHRRAAAHWETVRIGLPDGLADYLVPQGSVAVDGVSLTVVEVSGADTGGEFTVALIPTTLAATTLGHRRVGDRVNLEVDIVAKYVARSVASSVAAHLARSVEQTPAAVHPTPEAAR